MANLLFDRQPWPSGPVNLVFGANGIPVVPPAPDPLTISATITLGGFQCNASVGYDNLNPRRVSASAAVVHAVGQVRRGDVAAGWSLSQPRIGDKSDQWQTARQASALVAAVWSLPMKTVQVVNLPWVQAAQRGTTLQLVHSVAHTIVDQRATEWGLAAPRSISEAFVHQVAKSLVYVVVAPWGIATTMSAKARAHYSPGTPRSVSKLAPWQIGQKMPLGKEAWPKPEGSTFVPFVGDPNLLFRCPSVTAANLIFGATCSALPTGAVVVPIKKVYIVINSATLTRVDGGAVIPTLNMSMSLDVDSWTWSASASLPGAALDAVSPNALGDPVEVEAMFNGVPYRFLVESIGRDRTFNQSAIRISMRGKTALLDAPYSPVLQFGNTGARTMAQLMGDVLTENGVPMPWTSTWTPDDWLVPAGAFAHQGSYISALNALASAAGAYIQPHRTLQEISVLPRYPTAPWAWAGVTPDFELPSAIAVQEGIEWVHRPMYNRVFVSGAGQGVLGQVTRAGTDGGLHAPMITDALITDAIAVRQRGLPVLANTGRMANISLKLPVLPETGIISPGKMVRYVDGGVTRLGITRSVAVSVGASATDLRQVIALETHE